MAVNLPGFKGALSHFAQPGKTFADEITNRLKVIACIEKPNMVHSEEFEPIFSNSNFDKIASMFNANENDAQIIFWGPEEDIPTALETIEERCQMAFEGIPNETRKSFENGTTIFERVLPGADRMYPDTDSPPIPLDNDYIEKLKQNLPIDVSERYLQMQKWEIPEDTYFYILRNNLVPIIEKIVHNLKFSPKFVGTFFGHTLKNIEGKKTTHPDFSYEKIFDLFNFLKKNKIEITISKNMLPIIYEYPNMDFDSVLTILKFKRRTKQDLLAPIDFLIEKFKEIKISKRDDVIINWLMGQIHSQAIGNILLKDLMKELEIIIAENFHRN